MTKEEKGITLVALTIIIIVLLILAGVGITSGISTIKSARFTKFEAEMQVMQTEINKINQENEDANNLGQELTEEQKQIFNVKEVKEVLSSKKGEQETLKANFKYFTKDYLKNELKIEVAERDYYINIQERIIISKEPVEYRRINYYMLEQMPNGMYNVQTNKTGEVEFKANYEVVDTNKINIIVSSITGNNYTNKWQIRYKKVKNSEGQENNENWNITPEFEGDNYTIVVEEKGKYELEVFHKEEWKSATKEITISGIYDEEKEVNSPSLGGDNGKGLLPIKWNGENWEICSPDDPTWYNYSDQKVTVTNKEGKPEEVLEMSWANAMLSDGKYKAGEVEVGQIVQENELGSMFVWIPRFAYSINKYKEKQNPIPEDGTTQNITKVEFLKGTTNEGTSGNTYPKDYNADSVAMRSSNPNDSTSGIYIWRRGNRRDMGSKI